MAVAHRITEKEYLELALNEPDRFWELWDGVPVEKPSMSMRHNAVAFYLGVALANQLDRSSYGISANGDRARISPRNYYIPDVMVVPSEYQAEIADDGDALGVYPKPLPLVVEVWSPSTGRYDLAVKLQSYQERGDEEIWYIHPRDRTLTTWRKQPDGSYFEEIVQGGVVAVTSLPGVTIDLDVLLSDQPGLPAKDSKRADSQ
jgi:Uma2 family endonuclease